MSGLELPKYPGAPDVGDVDLPAGEYVTLENAVDAQHGTFEEHLAFAGAMSRRNFGRLALGTAAGAGLALAGLSYDTGIGDAIYGGGKPEIVALPNLTAEKLFPHRFCIDVGGFGSDTQGVAKAVQPAINNFAQMAYVKNSNNGLHTDATKAAALDFLRERNAEEVVLLGDSMGGMRIIELGAYLLANNVTLRAVVLDCSPSKVYDVRPSARTGAEILNTYNRITEDVNASGGPAMRFASESLSRWYQDTLTDQRVDVHAMVVDALRKLSPQVSSNKLLEDEATYICSFDGPSFGCQYSPNIPVVRFAPLDYDNDQTINNATALVGFQHEIFPQLGVRDIRIPHGGHADPGDHPAEYGRAIQKAFFDIFDTHPFVPILRPQ